MVAWSLAYESAIDGSLSLLRAAPVAWLVEGLSAEGLGLSFGRLSLTVSDTGISIRFSDAPQAPFRLYLRHRGQVSRDDIKAGDEHILAFEGNALLLRGGVKDMQIVLFPPKA